MLADKMSGLDLSSQSRYFVNDSGVNDRAIIRGLLDSKFKPIKNPNLGFSRHAVWIQFEVLNPSDSELYWILSFPYSLLDSVQLVAVKNGKAQFVAQSGDRLLSSKKQRSSLDITFQLIEPAKSSTKYYIKVRSSSSLQLSHLAFSNEEYLRSELLESIIYALFLGSFIAMGLYNISIAISTGSIQYYFYSILVILSVFREAYLSGMAYHFLWPNSPILNEYVGIYTMAVSLFLANAFTISFLELWRVRNISFYMAMIAAAISLFYLILFPLTDYFTVIKPIGLQVFVNSLLIFGIAAQQFMQGNKATKYFIMAWAFALLGWMLTSIAVYGIISSPIISKYANLSGQFLEIIFLSFALAERIQSLRREKNKAIRALNKGLEKQVREKTKDIQSILDSIPLGILKLDQNGTILKGHSRNIHRLLNLDDNSPLEGESILKILFDRSSIGRDEIAIIMNIISSSVDDSLLQWESNVKLLPEQCEFEDKCFELQWSPVFADEENSTVASILLLIKDVSQIRAIESDSQKKKRENEIIIEVFQTREKDFAAFIKTAEKYLEAIKKLMTANSSGSRMDSIDEAWRLLHTLKGSSRSLGLREISSQIHDLETQLKEVELNSDTNNMQHFLKLMEQLHDEILEYKRIDQEVLKRNLNQHIAISPKKIAHYIGEIERLIASDSINNKAVSQQLNKIKALYLDTLSSIAAKQLNNLKKIAEGLHKPLPRLTVDDGDYFFSESAKDLLDSILVHLIRNSLDHGIETPKERRQKGKDECGEIQISLQELVHEIRLIYQDDGRGLDIQKIQQLAVKNSLISSAVDYSASEIASLIFKKKFSTSERVTEISGRGVGMDAVKSRLLKAGGNIAIILDRKLLQTGASLISFHFEIRIPKRSLEKAESRISA